jgi:prepilin-type N-terminal cleavage/methylation domain-containing protein
MSNRHAIAGFDRILRCKGNARRLRCMGFTLLEVIVVIAAIGLLVSISLPAMQDAREATRRVQCQSNVRNVVLAFGSHESDHGHFPTNGWGWNWAGDSTKGFGRLQPGSWCFNILPYCEGELIHSQALPLDGDRKLQISQSLPTPMGVFYCPSRRPVGAYPFTQKAYPLVNSLMPNEGAKTDYAVCAGDTIIATPLGPQDDRPQTVSSFDWRFAYRANGVAYVISTIAARDVYDGLSQTIFIGEKYLPRAHYMDGLDPGDDQSCYIGDDADNRRWTQIPPIRDAVNQNVQGFGSPHRGVVTGFGDGSVRVLSFQIDVDVFRRMGSRYDR